jgi:hypothetical protein
VRFRNEKQYQNGDQSGMDVVRIAVPQFHRAPNGGGCLGGFDAQGTGA